MPIDSFILNPMLDPYRNMLKDVEGKGLSGDHVEGMRAALAKMEALGQEHSDITAYMGILMQEDLQAKFSDNYGKALAAEAKANAGGDGEGGYDDKALLKQSVDALKMAIKTLEDNYQRMLDESRKDPLENMEAEVDFAQRHLANADDRYFTDPTSGETNRLKLSNRDFKKVKKAHRKDLEQNLKYNPAAYDNSVEIEVMLNPSEIIKAIQDLVDLGEQEGMTLPRFLRIQMEKGLDKAMEGNAVTRAAYEEDVKEAKVAMNSPYHVKKAEEKLELFERLGSLNRFGCPNKMDLSLGCDDIDRKYARDLAVWEEIIYRWESILWDISHWAKSYCAYAPYWEPWSMSRDPKAATVQTQETYPGIIKEKEKLLQKYFDMSFMDIFKSPTFQWQVENHFIDSSQEYMTYIIEEVYPQCKPFNHLSKDTIAKQEAYEDKKPDKMNNPNYLRPIKNYRDYYNSRFGEGRYEAKFGQIEETLDPQASPWNLSEFKYN